MYIHSVTPEGMCGENTGSSEVQANPHASDQMARLTDLQSEGRTSSLKEGFAVKLIWSKNDQCTERQ